MSKVVSIKIKGKFKQTLMINWFSSHLHDKSAEMKVNFPNQIHIPLLQRYTLNQILKAYYNVELLFQDKAYNYYPIWEDCDCIRELLANQEFWCRDMVYWQNHKRLYCVLTRLTSEYMYIGIDISIFTV